jgi:glycosyltransferase involved in cell wall biosynthesis
MDRRPLRLAYLGDPNSVHLRRWIEHFADAGHDVHLLAGDRVAIQPGISSKVTIDRYRRFGAVRLPVVSSLQGRGPLRRLLRTIAPDLLHAHYLTGHGWQARLSGFHPWVMTVWGSDLLVAPDHSIRARWWARRSLGAADLVTVATTQLRERAIALGARPDRLATVRFGVDTNRYVPGPPDPEWAAQLGPGGRRVIFSPRAVRPLYRHETVVRSVAGLDPDSLLVMGDRGADPAYLASLLRLGEELGIGGQIRVLSGMTDEDMPALYRLADVVVSVPESDGLPLTVLEAMACGAPVVVSDLPGLREFLGARFPDVLVPVGDVDALRQALATALAQTAEGRASIGRAMRELVVAEADHRTQLAVMEERYRSLIRG